MGSHLRRLVVHRFRNVAPDTELHFDPGLNVVLGKNGSGKTTLLRVLESVLSGHLGLLWQEQASVTAEFEVEWQEGFPPNARRSGVSELRYCCEQGPEDRSIERLEIRIRRTDGLQASLRCIGGVATSEADGVVDPSTEGVVLHGDPVAAAGDAPLKWRAAWFAAAFPFSSTVERFPEDLSHYERLLAGEVTAAVTESGASVRYSSAQIAALLGWGGQRSEQALRQFRSPFLRELKIPDTPVHEAAARMGFDEAEVTMRANDTGARPVVYGDLGLNFKRKDGSWVREEKLSWGQKRFLSWWVLPNENERYVIADELTNGLHHEWIELLLERMAGKQAFLATQNPLLLDHLEFSTREEVLGRITACRIVPSTEREMLAWSNPSPAQADRFFASYELGFQHVSEILRLEDLW